MGMGEFDELNKQCRRVLTNLAKGDWHLDARGILVEAGVLWHDKRGVNTHYDISEDNMNKLCLGGWIHVRDGEYTLTDKSVKAMNGANP